MLARGLCDAQSVPTLPSVLKASHLKHRLNYVENLRVPVPTPKLPLPRDRLANRHTQTTRLKPRKPAPFRTIPSLNNEVDYVALRLVKSNASTTGYNLIGLYSHLLEEGHSCTWFDGRNALHFELSHRTWREMLLTHIQIQTVPHAGRSKEPSQHRRTWRSKSADANPPNVYNWFKGSAPLINNKIDCFVFACGAVVVWGLKPQLHIRVSTRFQDTQDDATPVQALIPGGAKALSGSQLQTISQSNASWNNDLISATLWFLSQFADLPVRADWISEDCLHYTEGRERPRQPRNEKGRRKHVERLTHDHLYLKGTNLEEKFAASLALQQNVILGVFEEAFESNVKSLGHETFSNPESADYGRDLRSMSRPFPQRVWRMLLSRLGMSRPEQDALDGENLVQKVADLYVKVIDINLVQKIIDVPEFFWEHPEYQKVWRSVHTYLEIPPRVLLLNNRCTWIQQLLTDLTQNKQGAREVELTWICILWICAYVACLLVECLIERSHQ